jgi:enoyl-CoA hydratase
MVVRYEQQDNIAIVTLDDEKANALSSALMDEAERALARATREAAAVVLTGRAGRFSAGFDLREMMAGAEQARSLVARGVEFLMGLYGLPMPLVIACSGHAVAGGALVVLTGDVRLGAEGPFKIGLNEVRIGMPLPILAIELARDRLKSEHLTRATLHSELADPATALAWGFLDEVVAADALMSTALEHATRLAALPRDAYAKSKVALRERTIRYIRDTLAEDMRRLTPPAAR